VFLHVTGKKHHLDDVINYVHSFQNQEESKAT
jgi:hypothetical protein